MTLIQTIWNFLNQLKNNNRNVDAEEKFNKKIKKEIFYKFDRSNFNDIYLASRFEEDKNELTDIFKTLYEKNMENLHEICFLISQKNSSKLHQYLQHILLKNFMIMKNEK